MTGLSDTEQAQPTPPATPASYWQMPSQNRPEFPGLSQLRARLVAVVAALVIQATIAIFDVLPHLPSTLPASDWVQPTSFWVQFALIEFLAAAVISLAFGPGVRLRDLPAIALAVLCVGFLVLPVVALALGGIEAAHVAAAYGPAAAISSELTTLFFGTIFFGLPLIALATPTSRSPRAAAPRVSIGSAG
jgi:hypothetical protein